MLLHFNRRRAAIVAVSLFGLAVCAGAGTPPPVSCKADVSRYVLEQDGRQPRGAEVRVTYLGTSTLLIEDENTQILVDGFVSRHSILSVGTLPLKSNDTFVDNIVAEHDMKKLKAMFVTHSHYDHAFDVAAIVKSVRKKFPALQPVKVYGSASTRWIGLGGDLDCGQIEVFEAGSEYRIDRFRIMVLDSAHVDVPGIAERKGNITARLKQPAFERQYKEGHVFDFQIAHCANDGPGACEHPRTIRV